MYDIKCDIGDLRKKILMLNKGSGDITTEIIKMISGKYKMNPTKHGDLQGIEICNFDGDKLMNIFLIDGKVAVNDFYSLY